MRIEQELYAIHNALKEHLSTSEKFEEWLAIARKIIRMDYHTLNLKQEVQNIFSTINEDIVTIKIDTSTPQEVYKEVLANIYRASKLKTPIKGFRNFSKEKHLLLILDVHFLNHYFSLSQQKIISKLEEFYIVDVHDAPIDTNEVNRLLKISRAIRATTNIISSKDYSIY